MYLRCLYVLCILIPFSLTVCVGNWSPPASWLMTGQMNQKLISTLVMMSGKMAKQTSLKNLLKIITQAIKMIAITILTQIGANQHSQS